MSAIPAINVSKLEPAPAVVTLTSDEAEAAAAALDVLDLYYQALSPRAARALKTIKQQIGGTR